MLTEKEWKEAINKDQGMSAIIKDVRKEKQDKSHDRLMAMTPEEQDSALESIAVRLCRTSDYNSYAEMYQRLVSSILNW